LGGASWLNAARRRVYGLGGVVRGARDAAFIGGGGAAIINASLSAPRPIRLLCAM